VVKIAVYNARLCALLSQQGEHKKALVAAKRAISHLRRIFLQDKGIFMKEVEMSTYAELKQKLLLEILEF
jgi:hypothetical protein